MSWGGPPGLPGFPLRKGLSRGKSIPETSLEAFRRFFQSPSEHPVDGDFRDESVLQDCGEALQLQNPSLQHRPFLGLSTRFLEPRRNPLVSALGAAGALGSLSWERGAEGR